MSDLSASTVGRGRVEGCPDRAATPWEAEPEGAVAAALPGKRAGGLNFHGPHEFLPVPSLEKASALVVKIIELTARKA